MCENHSFFALDPEGNRPKSKKHRSKRVKILSFSRLLYIFWDIVGGQDAPTSLPNPPAEHNNNNNDNDNDDDDNIH